MVVWFAICANKAEDSRNIGDEKQAVVAPTTRNLAHYWLVCALMTARYALMNHGSESPDRDAFAGAFRGVPGLTPMDASVVGRPDCGILVRNLTLEQGTVLQSNLKAAGIETEVVCQTALPALPNSKVIRSMEIASNTLTLRDCLQHAVKIGVHDLKLLAAGSVRLAAFARERKEVEETRVEWVHCYHAVFPIVKRETRVRHVEREAEQWALRAEILCPIVTQCFIIEGEDFDYSCLGSAMTEDVATNFCILIRELAAKFSPPLLSRGVSSIIGDPPEFAYYPNKDAFRDELIWLLWREQASLAPREN
jgi:hypothetical protein